MDQSFSRMRVVSIVFGDDANRYGKRVRARARLESLLDLRLFFFVREAKRVTLSKLTICGVPTLVPGVRSDPVLDTGGCMECSCLGALLFRSNKQYFFDS